MLVSDPTAPNNSNSLVLALAPQPVKRVSSSMPVPYGRQAISLDGSEYRQGRSLRWYCPWHRHARRVVDRELASWSPIQCYITRDGRNSNWIDWAVKEPGALDQRWSDGNLLSFGRPGNQTGGDRGLACRPAEGSPPDYRCDRRLCRANAILCRSELGRQPGIARLGRSGG